MSANIITITLKRERNVTWNVTVTTSGRSGERQKTTIARKKTDDYVLNWIFMSTKHNRARP